MERLALKNLVALAKQLAKDTQVYRLGMKITYNLQVSEFSILAREVYEHGNGTSEGFDQNVSVFEFEVMDVVFEIKKITS